MSHLLRVSQCSWEKRRKRANKEADLLFPQGGVHRLAIRVTREVSVIDALNGLPLSLMGAKEGGRRKKRRGGEGQTFFSASFAAWQRRNTMKLASDVFVERV